MGPHHSPNLALPHVHLHLLKFLWSYSPIQRFEVVKHTFARISSWPLLNFRVFCLINVIIFGCHRLNCVEELSRATMKKLTQGMDEQNKRMASASNEVKDKIVSIPLSMYYLKEFSNTTLFKCWGRGR